MSTRYNKNGIRILDDPKQANRLQHTRCLPDEHDWRLIKTVNEDLFVKNKIYRCKKCHDEMCEREEPLDEFYHLR